MDLQNTLDSTQDLLPVEDLKSDKSDLIRKVNIGLLPVLLIILMVLTRITFLLCRTYGQKTRSQPQRRMYGASRPRDSLPSQEPTIYVSPANYPPPPKYEHMAPPSYEEVVGINYPNYPPSQYPITTPLAVALAQDNIYRANHMIPGIHVTRCSIAETSTSTSTRNETSDENQNNQTDNTTENTPVRNNETNNATPTATAST